MGDDLGLEIRRVLYQRQTIDQATGVLMERNNLTSSEAVSRLRHLARTFNVPLYEIAAVVASG